MSAAAGTRTYDTFGGYDGGRRWCRRFRSPRSSGDLVDQAALADQIGVDFIGIGEHHRADFAVTSPDVVLSAIAGQTQNIHLGSAVTVLSSDDPVRVFQRFATLDAVSSGRAEVILGRGSFTESFPLFGYELSDYDKLFEEKVELFAALRDEQPVTWSGTTRSSLDNQSVFPHTESGALKTWLGVGGSPESVVRAAHYGFGLLLAPSSAASPSGSRLTPICSIGRRNSSAPLRRRSACTRPDTSPTRMSRPRTNSGRTTAI